VSHLTAKPDVGINGKTLCRVTFIAALKQAPTCESGDKSLHSKEQPNEINFQNLLDIY